jgi:outer membrane protein OmpA-like peptidoglycan-associated protein
LKDEDKTFEDVLLAAERMIEMIAATLAQKVEFDQGMDIPTQNIVEAIRNLQNERLRFAKEIRDRNTEISTLQDQFRAMNERLSKLSSAEEELSSLKEQFNALEKNLGKLSIKEVELRKEVEQQRIWKEKIARINNSFSREEGNALLDGRNIIIRLYGLTFPINKSEIRPQYFGLLTKLINAFAEFPDCTVIIEGHTDSQGTNAYNLELSDERAKAVKSYILANTDIPPDRIEAIGYGESVPVANNETPEGRAKNRRIDVVIKPVTLNEN